MFTHTCLCAHTCIHTRIHTGITQLTPAALPPWQGSSWRNFPVSPSEPRPTPTYLLFGLFKLTWLSSVWRWGKCLYLFFKYLGLAKDQHIFFFKVCIIWGQFDPYVSDSLALKSSKYWFLRAIWCLRNLFNKLLKLFKPRDWSRCQGPGWLLAGRNPSPGLWLLGAESHAPAAGLTSAWTPCLPQN